jgi:hypothetical protein
MILLGAEKLAPAESAGAPACWFDAPVGVWRNPSGGLALHSACIADTRVTATREGVDQSESSVLMTTATRTREGLDQAETTGR